MKKVILVEDDSAIIDIYQTMLKAAHFDVEVLSLGQDVIKRMKAVESKEEAKPDIILLDLILPDINGIEVLKVIKTNDATKDIKVFILTNQEESGIQPLGDIKPDKFLIKANITPTDLIGLIKKELS
ncbi:MAG: response regulator [bacterium]|nr:response regulator [bacterium]